MSGRTLAIGLIGAGSIAAYHIDGVRAAGGLIACMAAGSAESAVRAAARFGIPDAAPDWRALIARDGLDAVIVATPDDTHEEIASAAIDAGLPCLVQKPLAPTSAACARLVDRARARGVFLGTSFMHRHLPETRALRALMTSDGVRGRGRILSARLRNATPGPDWGDWFYDPARTGGVVMQLGVHGLDLIEHLFGPIAEVRALAAIRNPSRVLADGRRVEVRSPDHVLALHRLDSGIVVSHEILFGEVAGTNRFRLEITCEGGQIELRGAHGGLAVNDGTGWGALEIDMTEAGTVQHRLFLDDVRNGAVRDGTDIAGVQSVLTAEALMRAARDGSAMAPPRWRPQEAEKPA